MDPEKDSVKIKSLNNKLSDLDKDVKQFQKDIVKRTEGKLVSKMLKMSIDIVPPEGLNDTVRGAYLRDHYWDNTDLTDKRLARSQVFNNKVDFYFKKMMHQQLAEDPTKKSAKSKESNNKDLSNSCYINLDTSQTS